MNRGSEAGKIGRSDPNQFRAIMKPYQQLNQRQRYQIQAYHESETSHQMIGDMVGCHKSTISRELRRCPKGRYCAELAHLQATKARKTAAKATKYCPKLLDKIERCLGNSLSPAAIADRYKLERGASPVSHETIYQWIYRTKKEGGTLHRLLLRAHRGYRKRRRATDGRGLLAGRVSIDKRGTAANRRLHKGHWEGDTVHGHRGSLVTLVDRKSRFLVAKKTQTRTKNEVTKKLILMLRSHHSKTLTVDNGREFYGHQDVKKTCGISVFFADPFSSWQRGSNENANGLLRRSFPKGTNFIDVSSQRLRRVVEQINLMPRKLLGWKTAYEVHYGVSVALIT